MKYGRKIFLSMFWVLLGVVLIGCELAGYVSEFWSGMGAGFVAVGCLQIFRQIKYRTNAAYKEKVDVALEDERNKFLRNKAWAWAGYLFVLIAAISTIALRVAGRDELSMMASSGLCLMLVLYWGSYMVLSRKY